MGKRNLFCKAGDLHNEADVEQIFVRRFLEHLGYSDKQIRPKDSLTKLTVGGFHQPEAKYRPDFAIKVGPEVRWIVEAKAPDEKLDKHVWQPRSYCNLLNGQYRNRNPVGYFVLTNGLHTRLYQGDFNKPVACVTLSEVVTSNAKFKKLSSLLDPKAFKVAKAVPASDMHILQKQPLEDVTAAFAWCHQEIYRKDNISQAAAFTAFVKVVFLKLLSDRNIRDKHPGIIAEQSIEVPADDVDFSSRWLRAQEKHTPNPLDSIQFRNFIKAMEQEIANRKRKRIFDPDEIIDLSPETIRSVVARIEHLYLFGIDADLNGRLFETFLNATMRGKDLGQYFTPRSIVLLGTRIANIQVDAPVAGGGCHTDIVIDACCGTGGFLIEALAYMWDKINLNPSLEKGEKRKRCKRVATQHIYGVDVGRKPPVARIARMNMYLHGDGGGSIFQTDALDKELRDGKTDAPELIAERAQLRKLIGQGGFANVVLTNPPFAKKYERKTPSERRVLDGYEIATCSGKRLPSLKSNLMFVERYHDILVVGGRLVTVIDDGILSGRNYARFREFLRSKYLVKAVVSLPGDAFQRSKARVKTSLLVLEKRDPASQQEQPSVFMYGCEYVGIDDPARQRSLPIDKENRRKAGLEIDAVAGLYADFLAGNPDASHLVSSEKIQDRLDVKSCLMTPGRMVSAWKNNGISVVTLSELAEPVEFEEDKIIETKSTDDLVTCLRVTYEGFAEKGDEICSSDTTYSRLYRVDPGQIVVSNIAAHYGSTAIVPQEMEGCVVSSECTVLRPRPGVDVRVLWLLLRSPEARADMLLRATGANRTRVSWDTLKGLQLPRPPQSLVKQVATAVDEAEEAQQVATKRLREGREMLEGKLQLDGSEAQSILRAFKPPK